MHVKLTRLGVNVPPGFTLTTKVCDLFFSDGRILCDQTQELLLGYLEKLEEITGRILGAPDGPPLLAVRAGDTISIDGYTGEVFLGGIEIIEPEYPQVISDKDPRDLERYINTYIEWKKEFSGRA